MTPLVGWHPHETWAWLTGSPLFGLTLTLGGYAAPSSPPDGGHTLVPSTSTVYGVMLPGSRPSTTTSA